MEKKKVRAGDHINHINDVILETANEVREKRLACHIGQSHLEPRAFNTMPRKTAQNLASKIQKGRLLEGIPKGVHVGAIVDENDTLVVFVGPDVIRGTEALEVTWEGIRKRNHPKPPQHYFRSREQLEAIS